MLQLGTFFPERPYPVQATAAYPGWQQPQGVAPITVERLDTQGGLVHVDASRCYEETDRWWRQVAWTAAELSIRDEVVLKDDSKQNVMFRWHLGTDEEVQIRASGSAATVHWSDGQITFKADKV